MISRTITTLAAFAALALACGPASTVPVDKYYGPIDGSVLDVKLRAVTGTRCPAGVASCYPAQQVSLRGGTLSIYNMGTVTSGLTFTGGTLPASFINSAIYAYHFPNQCQADLEYDPFADPYPNDQQYPIFSALPLAPAAATTVVLPIVRVTGVGSLADNPCNALKQTASVEEGTFGAVPENPATASEARLWAVIDPGAEVVPLGSAPQFKPNFGWFRGLIFSYLDGGPIPRNASGNILTMEAVVVDPAGSGTSQLTANGVIILPFGPADPQYSPIIRLRHVRAATGRLPSSYTALCTSGSTAGGLPACTAAPNEVDVASASVGAPAETLIAVTAAPVTP